MADLGLDVLDSFPHDEKLSNKKVKSDADIPDKLVHRKRKNKGPRKRGPGFDVYKELPGTMNELEKEANEASRLHMSYGQYKAQKSLEWRRKIWKEI